jgi:hypothetical protein
MRTASIAACVMIALINAPIASAQSSDRQDSDQTIAGGGSLPAGWSARPDGTGDAKSIKFTTMEPGFHVTLGPAAIFYRATDMAKGPFHTLAKFTQTKKPKHPEGYGLFMGGQDLAGPNQSYTYFLVREDGTYLIKRRDGEKTSEITKGWTANSAVKKSGADGTAANLLEIDAKRNPSKIDFKVNGQTVHTMNASELSTKGIVGLRVNHNLDVHIEDFAVHQ